MKTLTTKILTLAFIFSVSGPLGFAQNHRFEITPHFGYRWGGTVDFGNTPASPNVPFYNKLSLQGSTSYGIGGGVYLTPNFLLDFDWMRQGTSVDARRVSGSTDSAVADFTMNTYHFGFNYFIAEPEAKLRPYARFSLGWTGSRPEVNGVDTFNRFSAAIGAGVKYYPVKNFSIGAQIQYMPAFLYSVNDGVWCGWYGCWASSDNHYLHQGDISLLFGFRF